MRQPERIVDSLALATKFNIPSDSAEIAITFIRSNFVYALLSAARHTNNHNRICALAQSTIQMRMKTKTLGDVDVCMRRWRAGDYRQTLCTVHFYDANYIVQSSVFTVHIRMHSFVFMAIVLW